MLNKKNNWFASLEFDKTCPQSCLFLSSNDIDQETYALRCRVCLLVTSGQVCNCAGTWQLSLVMYRQEGVLGRDWRGLNLPVWAETGEGWTCQFGARLAGAELASLGRDWRGLNLPVLGRDWRGLNLPRWQGGQTWGLTGHFCTQRTSQVFSGQLE